MERKRISLTKHNKLSAGHFALIASIAVAFALMLVPALANADDGPGQAVPDAAAISDATYQIAADASPILRDDPEKSFTVDDIDSQTYSTAVITPSLVVKDEDTGMDLATTDYDVSYEMNNGETWVDVKEIRDAGDYKVIVTGKNDYAGTIVDKAFTVTGAPVTITPKDGEKTYDGYPLTQHEFDVQGQPEADTHVFSVEMTKDSKITYAGYVENKIATVDGVDVPFGEETAVGNYLVTTGYAYLTIRKAPLTVTARPQTYTYNSSPQGPEGTYTEDFDTYVDVQGLVGYDWLTSLTMTGSLTLAGSFLGQIKPTGVVINGGEATDSYDITFVPGDLTINKAKLTITANQQVYKYDGTAQGEDNTIYTKDFDFYVTVEGLQGTDALKSITLNGMETNAGEYAGKIMPSAASVVESAGGNEIMYDYDVSYVGGPLIIVQAPVKIIAKDQTYTYNGSPQGEDNKTYTDGIDSKVEVIGLRGSDALTSITLNGQETNVGEYAGKIMPSAAEFGSATKNYEVLYAPGKLTINKASAVEAEYRVVSGAGNSWSGGSDEALTFTFKRTVDDEITFSHFTGIKVDGANVPEKDASGKANWTAKQGSVIVALQPTFMGTLAEGSHTISATFDDGADATAPFTVKATNQNGNGNSTGYSAGGSSSGTTAKTGDPLQSSAVLVLALSAVAGIALLMAVRRIQHNAK